MLTFAATNARVTKEGTVREAAIKDLREILIDKDGNLIAQRIQGLGTRITVNFGGKPVTLESAMQTIDTSYKTATGTVAESVKALASRMDDVGGATIEQAFKTVADKVAGVSSQYTLKVQTDQNGQKYIAGKAQSELVVVAVEVAGGVQVSALVGFDPQRQRRAAGYCDMIVSVSFAVQAMRTAPIAISALIFIRLGRM